MTSQILSGLAGFSMLCFGVRFSVATLDEIHAKQLAPIIAKFSNRSWLCFALGICLTLIVQASSITILLAMALVSRGVLQFYPACLIMLGATIGTSLKGYYLMGDASQISYILTLAALLITFCGRTRMYQKLGNWLFVIAFSVFGLQLLRSALDQIPFFRDATVALTRLDNNDALAPLYLLISGCLITVFSQSSSAVILSVTDSFVNGHANLISGFLAVLGAGIGTASTALFFSLGYRRDARRLAFAHLLMKIGGVLVVVLFLRSFVALIDILAQLFAISGEREKMNLYNVSFNLLNALVWWLLLPILVRATDFFIKPEKHNARKFNNKEICRILLQVPDRGLKECVQELINLVVEGRDVARKYKNAFISGTPAEVDELMLADKNKFQEQLIAIKDLLENIANLNNLPARDKALAAVIIRVAAEVDLNFMLMTRIGDEIGLSIQYKRDSEMAREQVAKFEVRFRKTWQSLFHRLHEIQNDSYISKDGAESNVPFDSFIDQQFLLGAHVLPLLSDRTVVDQIS